MEFKSLLECRRSVRAFDGRPVSREQIQKIAEDIRMAPSWKNSQTGRIYATYSPEYVEEVRKALPEFNQRSTEKAPAFLVSTFKKGIAGFAADGTPTNELGDGWGAYDLGLQNAYLILSASEQGLDTLIMGCRDADALRKLFSIPAEEEIVAVIALGYRAGEPVMRPRKSAEELLQIR